jgi:hypothetical protein
MSARNPLTIIKNQIYASLRRAYFVRGIRVIEEQVRYIWSDVQQQISPTILQDAILSWIRDLVTNKMYQQDNQQLDLWEGDHFFPVKITAADGSVVTENIPLRDLQLDHISQIEERKQQNIDHATKERDRFSRYVAVIRPVMIERACTWGEAVDILKTRGPLPDLG